MARKTTKLMQALLANHENLTRYWATKETNADGESVSSVYREGILTGLNVMLEAALHNAGCYHGFRYVKFVSVVNDPMPDVERAHSVNGYVTHQNFTMGADGKTPVPLTSVEEQTRQYFAKV